MIINITEFYKGIKQSIGVNAIMYMYPQIDNDGSTIIQLIDHSKVRTVESYDQIQDLITLSKVDRQITVKVNDVIILESPINIHPEHAKYMIENLNRLFPDNRAFIIDGGTKIRVATGETDGI